MSVGSITKELSDFLNIRKLMGQTSAGTWHPENIDYSNIHLVIFKSSGSFLYDTYRIGEKEENPKGYRLYIQWFRDKKMSGYFSTGDNCFYDGRIDTLEDIQKVIREILSSRSNRDINIWLDISSL